jgi:hypothetical protein
MGFIENGELEIVNGIKFIPMSLNLKWGIRYEC